MAGASQKRTSGRTTAGTGQKKTTQKKTTQTGAKRTAVRSRSSRSTGSRSTAARKPAAHSQSDSFMGTEITILAAFAVCALLFLSNLGVCGAAGAAVRQVQSGVFGLLGYVFPVALFAAVLFYISNRGNGRALAKLAVSAGVFLLFCGFVALITTKKFDASMTAAEYYAASVEQPGGGAVGGLFLKLLCPAIGKIGACVVILLLATIGIVFVTERSVLQPISKGSRKVYDTAREDAARCREIHAAKAEERRKYRLEQKVSGVALDTRVGDYVREAEVVEETEEPFHQEVHQEAAEEETASAPVTISHQAAEPAPKKSERLIRITGLNMEETQSAVDAAAVQPVSDSPIIPSPEDIMIAKKDTRTLAELEALDSLHGNVFTQTRDQAIWNETEEKDFPRSVPTDAGVQMHLRDIRKEEEQWEEPQSRVVEEPEPEVSSMDGDVPADVKRVVTASGKVIEAEIDPDDDPLTYKRMKHRMEEREAANPENHSARGSQGDTVRLAGGQGGGLNAMPDPDMPVGLRPDGGNGSRNFGQNSSHGHMQSGAFSQSTSGMQMQPHMTPEKPKPPKPYVMPPYRLMKAGDNKKKGSERELRETAHKLETTLQNFGVGVSVTNISCGPAVTRYELQPEQGVRVSKIVNLADDIKLNLAAADIRIEAPIPGKASVGIEVPNKENSTVFLRDVLESPAFKNHPSKLAFAVGRDISGEVVVTDLAKMPHLLIAGATGSGKSVCINTLIMSVLYKAKPEEVRLIMVDPKVVELSVYNGIPHLMIPVVTDPKKAAGALNWAVAEMTDRYRKFADWNVRDLKGYNEKIREEAEKNGETVQTLPQIVIIVDELSDLMMVCPGDVEDAICRLAQMARAAGIHLVIATQRPSVNVITGLIKANVPSRIAFSVSSGVDSRTIIDMNGAEKLLGKGDMLFYPSGYQKPVRVQGAFVSDSEVASVVEFVNQNNQSRVYDSAIEARMASLDAGDTGAAGGNSGSERDEYFVEAGRFVIEKQKATIGMLQRVFKIGFNRAARIMDQLAEAGVVGDDAGTKAREILIDMGQYEQLLQELGIR